MKLTIRVGRKHTLYLPKEVVEKLRIREGDKLLLEVHGDKIIVRQLPRLLEKRRYWAKTSIEEFEQESEEQTRIAEED